MSERYADGEASEADVYPVREGAEAHFRSNYMHLNGLAYKAAACCGYLGLPSVAAEKVYQSLGQNNLCPTAEPLTNDFFCGLLRDIIGNPFRPSPPLPAAVLTWNDGIIPRIAQGIYDARRLPDGTLDTGRLAILHDALLDAGCTDEALLTHCRSPGPHARGCWAIDRILEKS